MEAYLLEMFGISLLLTIVIELAVAKLLKISMTKQNVQLIALVNCLTNPAAVWLVWIGSRIFPGESSFLIQTAVEVVVVLVEAKMYRMFAADPTWNIRNPVRLAVVANLVAWLAGGTLQGFAEAI